MEERKQYIQFTEPDKASLGKLLGECKGPDRTMAQMGEATGLSPSMLSRILNGNITKPLPEETLQAIFDQRAQGCTVTLDDLFRANGYVTVEERNRMVHGVDVRRQVQEQRDLAQQIIINELLKRGYAVKADISSGLVGRSVMMNDRTDADRGDLPVRYDLGVTLPELHDLSEWLFDIVPLSGQSPFGGEPSPERDAKYQIRRRIQMHSNIFLVDAWQPERLEGMKFSFVFTDKYLYDAFRDYIRTAKLNNAMSTILVDISERIVIKEEWLKCPMMNVYSSLFRDERDRRPGTDYVYRPKHYAGVTRQIRYEDEIDGEDTE